MIEQPDSEKPRDEWSDPRTTPASDLPTGRTEEEEELAAIVIPSDAEELSQLQADLDAAVDAEPVTDPTTQAELAKQDSLPDVLDVVTHTPSYAEPEVEPTLAAVIAQTTDLSEPVNAESESGRSTDGRPVQFYGQDSAAAAEPVFAHDANSITIDPNGTVWVNKGKAPAPITKFRALNGGQIVYALPVKGFRADQKTAEQFIILSDDSERPRPLLHGYIPKVGDMFVQYTPITVLDTNQAYVEQGETIIMGKRLFEALYYPVQE